MRPSPINAFRSCLLVLSTLLAGSAGAATFNISVCYDGFVENVPELGFGDEIYSYSNDRCIATTGNTITGENADHSINGRYQWFDYSDGQIYTWSGFHDQPVDWELEIHYSYQFEITDVRPGEDIHAVVSMNNIDFTVTPGSHSFVFTASGTDRGCDREWDVHCDPKGVAWLGWEYSIRSNPAGVGEVPLPGAAALMAGGLFALSAVARRRTNRNGQCASSE